MSSFNILPLQKEDLEQARQLQPDGWPDILPNLVFYTSWPSCLPIKVMSGDRIIGTGTSILHADTAWLAHIIVHPDYRNQGIGRLITQYLVAGLKDYPTIYLIATDLGAPVYLKLGFENETEYVFYKDISGLPKQEASSFVIPYHPDFLEQLLLLDKEAYGEDRSILLQSQLGNGLLHVEEGRLNGFFLPDLGEGLILARKPAAGLELMALRFNSKETTAFPLDNTNAHQFMQEKGFPELRRAKRMRLGEKRDFKPEYVYSRIGGNLG